MKKTMRFLSMAALALVGAVTVGCSSDDNIVDEPQQPVNNGNVVTLTTTVSLDGDAAATRALTSGGVKTFAEGELIALVYKNTSNVTVKAVSAALTPGNITNEGKSATFTFELTNPNKTQNVTYIYPAAMAKADGSVNYDALASQDGTLTTLSSSIDLATYSAAWDGSSLPTATLANQLAVLALTLKDNATPTANDITNTITGVTITEGSNSYAVTRSAAAGPIYVAVKPTSSASISVTAIDGSKIYTKSLTGKTYAANNGYSLSWIMAEKVPVRAINGKFTINAGGTQVNFSHGNLQATYCGSSWIWACATNQWDYVGNAVGNTKVRDKSPYIIESGTVDLFGWVGASSKFTDAAQYGISSSTIVNSIYGYGNGTNEALKSDWGNTIGSGWRTLTRTEWKYIFNTRNTSTVNGTNNARYAKATVVSKPGIILFPDSYTHPGDVTAPTSINTANADFTANSYDATDWAKMEAEGCVFLPAAGYRNDWTVYQTASYCNYWSSTPYNGGRAYYVNITSNSVNPESDSNRHLGYSVRLVHTVE